MDGNGNAVDAQEVTESLETIKSIEMMGFFMEEAEVKLKWARGIFHCMDILRQMHDQLVSKLPPEVIDRERAKQGLQTKTTPKMTAETLSQGVA